MEEEINPIVARLGPYHPDSYTADWCVAVWPHPDGWITDRENGDGMVDICTVDPETRDIEVIWSGHVTAIPFRV